MQITKKRYLTLDVMRAIAGLSVPVLHLLEGLGGGLAGTWGGHIYFAVESFMLLMGYMLGYAYDARWQEGMNTGSFFRRRLIRLHPYVLTGVGLALLLVLAQFCGVPQLFDAKPWFGEYADKPVVLLVAVLFNSLMLPVPGMVLLSPLNPCSWTLYYEYLGNVLYGFILRHIGVKGLIVLSACGAFLFASYIFHVDYNALFGLKDPYLAEMAKARHSIEGGWCATTGHFLCGMSRLLFPLCFGLLLSRLKWRIRLPSVLAGVFCGVFFLVLLFTPKTWFAGNLTLHGAFESAVIFLFLPLMILIGVGNEPVEATSRLQKAIVFFAELSYPLYMSHFMFMQTIHRTFVEKFYHDMSSLGSFVVVACEYIGFILVAWCMMALVNAVTRTLKR